jgi:V/A-type H+-transporting ATPase subunit I
MRRFETFVRAIGLPSANEVDPSPLLALTMPLMFGYMFGDVGQGAVLLLAGLLLRERMPIMGLFVPAGVSAIVFGFVFGSIFCFEHIIPPLWINPMEDPMLILAVPLLFGAAYMLTGLLLASVQAHWAGQGGHWWQFELPVVIIYLGVLALLPAGAAGRALIVLGLAWLVLASALRGARRSGVKGVLLGPLSVFAPLIEDLFQLLINTLSFVRVGAFALAHVGLSTAVLALSEIPESALARGTILVLGNLLVVGLEGLIVSIQTTRLVLFEFFRRFLHADGRPFRPLAPPPSAASEGGETVADR